MERIISSCTGIPPPTRPVLPDWGQTARLCLLQYFNIFEIFCVVLGSKTNLDLPLYFDVQSILNYSMFVVRISLGLNIE